MNKPILLDAIYINNSGGKVLLDYLIQELEKSGKSVFYLLDNRIQHTVGYLDQSKGNVLFMEASLIARHKFLVQNKDAFSSILCFGDLPPSTRMNATVYTYFHQQLYIKFPSDIPRKDKIFFLLKRKVLQYIFKYSDYWMLQTENILKNFKEKFKVTDSQLLLYPYYPAMEHRDDVVREKSTYVYISNAPPHKNHIRLISAFCHFYDQHKTGKLILTVDFQLTHLAELIHRKVADGYPIVNLGFVEREKLSEIYHASEYLVYPSLAESFGLGLVEAIDSGCKVMGADLPYLYAVCDPSITFDPLDEQSICNAFVHSLQDNIKPSVSRVPNKIDDLVSLL